MVLTSKSGSTVDISLAEAFQRLAAGEDDVRYIVAATKLLHAELIGIVPLLRNSRARLELSGDPSHLPIIEALDHQLKRLSPLD